MTPHDSAPSTDGRDTKIDQSLKLSIREGVFSSAMVGLGESYFIPFALFLGANNIHVALISGLPQALGSLVQLLTGRLIRFFRTRKRLIVTAALLQALVLIPIAAARYMGGWGVYHLLGFACLYWAFGMALLPAWQSWMGDLTSQSGRGAYFGRRSTVAGLAAFVAYLSAGYVLEGFSSIPRLEYYGFALIFGMALLMRFNSAALFMKQYEPPYAAQPGAGFTFWDFLTQAEFRNYGLFVLYLCLMNFSVSVAAPYFTPYMLKDLGLGYLDYTLINATVIIVKIGCMPLWGRMSDRFGAKFVLEVTGVMLPVVPLLWLFTDRVAYLMLIQLFGGFVWAGFEIGAFIFLLDATQPERRPMCVAYFSALNGIAILAGALIGGFIARHNDVFWSKYVLGIFVSAFLRMAVALSLLPRIKEVRMVEAVPYSAFAMRAVSMIPTHGLTYVLIPLRRFFRRR